LPAPMKPRRNASPFAAAGVVGTGWRGGAAIACEGDEFGGEAPELGGLSWWWKLAGADVRFPTVQRGLYGKKCKRISSPLVEWLLAPANLARRLPTHPDS
jgi:hypothetical protein